MRVDVCTAGNATVLPSALRSCYECRSSPPAQRAALEAPTCFQVPDARGARVPGVVPGQRVRQALLVLGELEGERLGALLVVFWGVEQGCRWAVKRRSNIALTQPLRP